MLKFFRRIRQQLLNERRVGKYLLYAIGEIVLVVIGILIALQINNWNERRKQQQVLASIYSIITEDLTNDIVEIKESLKIKKYWEPIFKKVLDGSMTKEDYQKCPECVKLIWGFNDMSINTRGYNLLNVFDNSSNIKEDTLSLKITQFYSKQFTILHADDRVKLNDIESNIIEWKNKYDWSADFMSGRDNAGFLEYALNNQDYTNRVATYYLIHYRTDIPKCEAFIKGATSIINLMEEKLGNQ